MDCRVNILFGNQSLVGRTQLGKILTKQRLKELTNQYRLIVVVGREIHIVTDPLELNDHRYPERFYRVEEIDVRGQWVEVKHHPQKNVPFVSK